MIYATILAGGSGTRLWPRSREQRPKQFLDLIGERTMLQQAVDRIEPIIPLERVFVITNREYCRLVHEQLPQLPAGNAIGEPAGRGTAPAIGLGAIKLRRVDPEALMVILTADHVINRQADFRAALLAAAEVAQRGYLVTLGITPTHPETGYGYIERGEPLKPAGTFEAYRVARFVEKPDLRTAEEFVAAGRYAWNSGMFLWRVEDILTQIELQMPDLYVQLLEIEAALEAADEDAVLQRVWPAIAKQTIDYGVMEHAPDVAVLPVDIGWNDVGSWAALHDLLPVDAAGNATVGEVELLDTRRSLVYSPERLVVTIGVEDLLVVDAGDVTLICRKDRAQDVRLIVERLQQQGKSHYLRALPGEGDPK